MPARNYNLPTRNTLKAPRISGGFRRVSKKRPCRICESTTYCGFTADERMSICMWVSEGSIGPSRNGGNKHVHHEVTIISTRSRIPTKPEPLAIAVAPIEVRDAVYRELIRISPARRYYPHLVAGPDGLLHRGFTEAETYNYGALPPSQVERAQLAYQLHQFAINSFPQYGALQTTPVSSASPDAGSTRRVNRRSGSPANSRCPCLSFLTRTNTAGSRPASYVCIKATSRKVRNDIAGFLLPWNPRAAVPALRSISPSDLKN